MCEEILLYFMMTMILAILICKLMNPVPAPSAPLYGGAGTQLSNGPLVYSHRYYG